MLLTFSANTSEIWAIKHMYCNSTIRVWVEWTICWMNICKEKKKRLKKCVFSVFFEWSCSCTEFKNQLVPGIISSEIFFFKYSLVTTLKTQRISPSSEKQSLICILDIAHFYPGSTTYCWTWGNGRERKGRALLPCLCFSTKLD